MSEPVITPLAQRLAEENNVDWRGLQGSGEGGRIVERDVLEYLARVMAGDEAVNPTPEPLPEGLEEWPEAAGWSGEQQQSAQAASWNQTVTEAGHDDLDWPSGDEAQDFGTPVAFDAEEAELKATGEYPAPEGLDLAETDDFLDDDEYELSEDIFLFGETEDSSPESQQAPDLPDLGEPLPPREPFDQSLAEDDLDDLAAETLFLSEDADETLGGAEPPVYLDDDPEDDLKIMDELQLDPDEELLGRSDDLLDDSQFEDADLTDLALTDGELDDPGLVNEPLDEFERGFDLDSLEEQAAGQEGAPDGWQPAADGPHDAEAEASGSADEFDIDFGDLDEPADVDAWQDAVELAADLEVGDSEQEEADALARRIEAAFESVADARPEFENFEADTAEQPVEDERQPAAPLAAPLPAEEGLPFASFGTLLRRQLDVSQLNQARKLVGAEISGGDSVSAITFLLLAARRAATETGFSDEGAVAAALIRGSDIELVADSGAGFRGLAQRLQQVATGAASDDLDPDSLSLAVADMSGLEVDEAVLDLGLPMLSLGRSLHDEDANTFRSTLTLSGHFDLQTGARFLQEASELLANPLRLLL